MSALTIARFTVQEAISRRLAFRHLGWRFLKLIRMGHLSSRRCKNN